MVAAGVDGHGGSEAGGRRTGAPGGVTAPEAGGAGGDELDAHGLVASMSRKGDCFDNAVVESSFSTLKNELVHLVVFATRQEARKAIFEFIEMYYDRQRRHSTLGYLSPIDYEYAMEGLPQAASRHRGHGRCHRGTTCTRRSPLDA